MKEPKDYLNDLERKTGSDYKTAKLLNVNKSTISHIRSRGLISDETAIKVADALGIDRTELLIAAALARSEGEVKSAWIEASKRAGIAASTLLAIRLATTSGQVDAATLDSLTNMHNNVPLDYVYYVK
jgi:intergrase/recombinase